MSQNQMNQTPANPLWPLDMELYIADGEPYVFDDTLYLYGSRDVPGGMVNGQIDWCSEDYHVVCSKDLVNWKDCGRSYSLDEIPGKDGMGDRPLRLWAPDACYNPKDQKYYLFSCLNGGRGFFVASSDLPEGPFTNTKRLTIDHEDIFPACIDPGVLMDDDGKAYITWPAADAKPWGIAQLDPDDFSNKDDRHLFFDRVGQYAGWRYVDFGDLGSGEISITVHCETACVL